MRPLKLAAVIVGAVVALFVIVLILAVLLIDPNKYKDSIARAVEAKTGRHLTLAGDLKLSVFPWLALETGALQLSEAPGFGEEPFVAVQHARLGVKLLPLLRKQIEIGEVTLDEPRIRLITGADGHSNWESLTGNKESEAEQKATQPEEEKQTGGALEIPTVAGVKIRGGDVSIENRQAGTTMSVHKLELATGRVAAGQPVDFNMSAIVIKRGAAPAGETTLDVHMSTQISADTAAKRYELHKLELNLDMAAAGSTPALEVKASADSVTADLQAETLQVPEFKATAGSARLNGALSGTDIVKAPRLSGHLTLAQVSLRELLPQLGIAVPPTQDKAVLTKLSFDAALQATSNSLTLGDLMLVLDDTHARGRFSVADMAKNALRFNLDIDGMDFDRYLAPKLAKDGSDRHAGAGGSAAGKPTELPLELIRKLDVQGDIKVGQAVFDGIHLSKLHLGIAARDGVLRFNPSQAALYGGTYSGDIRIDASGKEARVSLDEHVNGVDFAPLLKDLFATERMSGHGAANIKAVGVGRTTDDLVRTLDGNLDFNVNNGAFEGVDLWYEIRRARAVIRRETVPQRTGPAHTVFQQLKGSGVIKAGVLDNKDLAIDTQFLKIAGQGSFNLPKQSVDYRLTASVLRLPSEGADAAKTKDLVDARIPIKVSGPVGSLTVLPDFEGFLKDQGKQRLNEEKKKLQDKLQDKLKGLFGGH